MSSRAAKPAAKATNGKNTSKSEPIELSDSDSSDDAVQVTASRNKSSTANGSNKKPAASTSKITTKSATVTPVKKPAPTNKRKAQDPDSDESSDDVVAPAKKRASLGGAASTSNAKSVTATKKKSSKIEDSEDDYDDDDNAGAAKDDDEDEDDFPEDDDDEEEEEEVKPKKKAAPPAKKPPPKKPEPKAKPTAAKAKAKNDDDEDDKPAKPKGKPVWVPGGRAGPSDPGSKEIPEGAPDCLGGLTIVFTGELSSIGRPEATTLAKRFGAKVTTSVSSKTSYVVLGEGAGEAKLKMIAKNNIPTLTEDGFLNLIATRGAKDLDDKYLKKQKEEEKKIKEAARTMGADPAISKDALWTVKYAPKTLKDICGNTGVVEKLKVWLESWPKNLKSNFMKPGKDGWGIFRAALLSGPPGIGKTTAAHLVAELCGYKVIEMNASDTRSKKLLEAMLKSTLDNTVLDGFLTGKAKESAPELSTRSCIIMDEVDGTSAGDRGGIGALNALIKKTKVPIICIANDKSSQKMKPLTATTYDLKFRRPDANMVRARLMSIAFREGMKIDKTVADQLVAGTQSDIRQIINTLSTWSLSSKALSFDQTKKLMDGRDSNSLATPFQLMDKLFSPYSWSQTSNARVSDKLEVYFQEFDLMPMFVQENYLKHKYARAGMGTNAQWKKMQLTSQAADAISDGDMIDRMIHGTQQHWSLMPTHGMMSTVLPSYYCYGQGSFGGWNGQGENSRAFPSWFGKNSTQGRLQRSLTDIQIHMRLKVSGDKREIRQSYIPNLLHKLVMPLVDHGADAIGDVIKAMDEYYLSKDEWDALVEMGIGDNTCEPLLKKIPAATKTAFTRKYNTADHPIPFHKATDVGPLKRMAGGAEKPDLEEAFEVEPEPEPEEDEKKKFKKGEDENTIKDKLVKEKKPKAGSKAATGAAAKVKPKAAPKPKAKTTKK